MQYVVVNAVTTRVSRAHRIIGELFRLNILEDRVLCQASFHIPLYDKGEYHDMDSEEKKLIDKDIAFIKSKVQLIPKNRLKKVEE